MGLIWRKISEAKKKQKILIGISQRAREDVNQSTSSSRREERKIYPSRGMKINRPINPKTQVPFPLQTSKNTSKTRSASPTNTTNKTQHILPFLSLTSSTTPSHLIGISPRYSACVSSKKSNQYKEPTNHLTSSPGRRSLQQGKPFVRQVILWASLEYMHVLSSHIGSSRSPARQRTGQLRAARPYGHAGRRVSGELHPRVEMMLLLLLLEADSADGEALGFTFNIQYCPSLGKSSTR